ncbi:hypothetical protein RMN56_04025 [Micromonospora halotolerans]|uniref:Uncharacterized protein n=1 Tax=Micromonospora halotolerans TaxID=709879 RepID=A0ABY9ZZ95_9ACTN|nr:hypothetical protein [Micromonospora halotolerans]WNM40533.1 hypothetical protein RMN56_04025 [Micromonospora halotolerans]
MWSRERGKRHVAYVVLLALALLGATATLGHVGRPGPGRHRTADGLSHAVSGATEPGRRTAGPLRTERSGDFAVGEEALTLSRATATGPFTAAEVA